MPLPRDSFQEDSLDPGPQDMSPGSDTQAAPIGMIEEPESDQETETSSDTQIPYTVEG